jgi:hypothetical protein
MFLKWNDGRYATHEDVLRGAPIWRHSTIVDAASVFATGARPPAATTKATRRQTSA